MIAISVMAGYSKWSNFKNGQHSPILIVAISVIEEHLNSKHFNSGQHSAILVIVISVRIVHLVKLKLCIIGQHSATLIIALSSKNCPSQGTVALGSI
jgi:hypothetical protein